jgi:outer membrane protein assembly factor BamB
MRRLRWWPAALVLSGAFLWLIRIWFFGDAIRQYRILETITTAGVSGILLVLWLLLASGLRARTRLAGFAAILGVCGAAAGTFRIQGVTGDLVPILAPRWSAQPGAVSSEPPPSPPARPAPSSTPVAAPRAGKPASPGIVEPNASVEEGPRGASADYPQFLGPNRDGVLPGPRLARDWGARPPRALWRHSVGAGWSGFAVARGLAVTQEQQGEQEEVVAYDAGTGDLRWRHSDHARYDTVIAGIGPRATPTIVNERVYTMGATGILNALRLRDGRLLWSRRVLEENGAENPSWGTSGSPLLDEDRVVVSAGGPEGRSLVAYRADTGEPLWSFGHDRQSYSSPTSATLAGRRQILIFNQESVAAHDATTGALLWEQPWSKEQPNVAQPLPIGDDRVLFSAGYGVGSKLYQVGAASDGSLAARLVWESPRLKAKFTNLVIHEGFVYGLDDGVLTCLDPSDGQRRWREGRYGHGQVILVGGLLLVGTEDGQIVLVEPSPQGRKELTRFTTFEGKTWNPPALAGNRLYVRTDREAAAYELPVED